MVEKIVHGEYFVYIVKCSDGTLYTGYTTDINRRLTEHNSENKAAKYTKQRRPVELVYSEKFDDESTAKKREWQIKKLSKKQKIKMIEK